LGFHTGFEKDSKFLLCQAVPEYYLSLNVQVLLSAETSVPIYQSRWYNILEDSCFGSWRMAWDSIKLHRRLDCEDRRN